MGVQRDYYPSLPPIPGGMAGWGQSEVKEAGGEEEREESGRGSGWGEGHGEWAGAAGEGSGLQAKAVGGQAGGRPWQDRAELATPRLAPSPCLPGLCPPPLRAPPTGAPAAPGRGPGQAAGR